MVRLEQLGGGGQLAGSVGTAYLTLVPKLEKTNLISNGEQAGQSFGNGFSSKLSTAAKVGASAMAATVAGVGLAAGAIKGAISATAEYGDNVDKMSQKIGISASSYQEWAYVMERAGTSVDILQSGMKTLSTQAEKNASEFQALGISEEEVASLSKEDLFGRVIEGLSNMEDGTERTAIATKLLGKSATELGPLLNEGTDAINEQRAMAEKYGLVMSDAAVKASAEFQDSLTTLNGAITGAKNALMGELLPSATLVSDGLTQIIVGNVDGGIELISQGISSMVSKIKDAFPSFIDAGSRMIMAMLEGLDANAPSIINSITELLTSLISYIPTFLPILFSVAVQLFMGIVQAIPSILGALLGAIGSLIMQGVNKVSSYVSSMFSSGASLIGGVVSGLASIGGNVAATVGNIVSSAPGAVRDFVGRMASAGGDLIRGLVNGLWNSAGAVADALWNIASNAVDSFKSFFGIASPSKLMRKMGGFIGDGLALGIEDGENAVESAMQDLMSATYGAADYGVSVSGEIANSNNVGTSMPDVYEAVKAAVTNALKETDRTIAINVSDREVARVVRAYA